MRVQGLVIGCVLASMGFVADVAASPIIGRGAGDERSIAAIRADSPFDTTSIPAASKPASRQQGATFADAAQVAQPWGTAVRGLLTFRGNPTRSFYGTGPIPTSVGVLWRYPNRPMCGQSSEYGEIRIWCGTGWTGQPAVFERDGRTWLVFGAYDYGIHFVDAATGLDIGPPVMTGDIAKGTVTVDPDGYPLVYAGSRDNYLRVIAIDRPTPEVLWSLDAHATGERKWNDDWDAAPLVLNDFLIEGGENSRMHAVRLNRSYGADGKVTVAPELAWSTQAWDAELLAALPDQRVSLESSVMVLGDIAYVASSGGLVQGWDLSELRVGDGTPDRVFRYWTGDDTDATIVADDAGYLYVGVEVDRATSRGREVGQLLKLDPRATGDPLVWSVDVNRGPDSGTWSTPAIYQNTVIWATKPGVLYGIDRATGVTLWTLRATPPVVSSPVVVDGILIQADGGGNVRAWNLGDGQSTPTVRWVVKLPANVESTPAVWNGRLYVGSRDGYMYSIGV
jgi:outer membrane protein assembly factor BamB